MHNRHHSARIVRFGLFEVDLQTGELRKNGIRVPLQGQPFQVCAILLARSGELVTREELRQQVWPKDTFVDFDHALNTAITKIRVALGDDADNPRFIETLPRRGYRFIGSVEAVAEGNVATTGSHDKSESKVDTDISGQQLRKHLHLAAYSIPAVLAALVVASIFLVLRKSPAPLQRSLTRLTFEDGLQFGATWSPDERFIAYASDRGGKFDIWVQQLSGGDPVQVTHGPGQNWQPDWSPDGKYLAYRSEDGDGGLFIIPALGGVGLNRKVASFGCYPQWSPDSSRILFQNTAIGTSERFYVVDLDGNLPREILLNTPSDSYAMSAAWHPDGKRISIWVWEGTANPIPTFWTVSMAQGKLVRTEISPEVLKSAQIVAGEFTGWGDYDFRFSWAPSGDALYFERTIRRAKNIWKMTIDPGTLRAVGLERITTGAGPDSELALSPSGKKIAFTGESARIRGWAFPFTSAEGRLAGSGRPVTSPGVEAWQQTLSLDGKKLAFAGKRGGRWELWVTTLAEGHQEPIAAEDDPYERIFPQWSPDGTRLAYMRQKSSTGETEIAIWSEQSRNEVGLMTPLHTHKFPYDWSPDGKWLLSALEDPITHRDEIWRLPADDTVNAEVVGKKILTDAKRDLYQARYSPDGRWIVFEAVQDSQSILYVIPAGGGAWIPITDGKHWCDKPRWSADGKRIYFLCERHGFFNVWGTRFDSQSGKAEGDQFPVTSFESARLMIPNYIPSIDFSLDRSELVLTMQERTGSIWVLDNVSR